MTLLEPRLSCQRCGRPIPQACFCDRITLLPTRTRILLLQHPRERRMGIGTARLAHLALPGSQLRVSVDFSADPVVRAAIAGSAPPYVLFPGADARPVHELPPGEPITLIVLDGTWAHARKLLGLNPILAALPRVAFAPRRPSGYLIRKQPAPQCVSTIEALAEVLDVLEPDNGPFDRLLDPFRAMVEKQRWFETTVRASRHHRPPGSARPRRDRLRARLAELWPRLVCVQGEANAWASRDPDRQAPETIHWLAHRPASGQTFQAVVAPRRPLAPSTPFHVQLPGEQIRAGIDQSEWHQRWLAFSRPDDVLVTWGSFYRTLAAQDRLALPPPEEGIDLRVEITRLLRRRVGTIEDALAHLQAGGAPLGLPGRGGRRLSGLVGVMTSLYKESDVAPAAD